MSEQGPRVEKNKENEGNVKNSWTFFKIKEVAKALNE